MYEDVSAMLNGMQARFAEQRQEIRTNIHFKCLLKVTRI